MQRIDLNGDVGESFGSYTMGDDEAMLRYVTSANVACGFHGGDPSVMRRTVGLAVAGGVAIGAHPGFADLVGFGRREIRMQDREVENLVAYQIGALAGVTASAEARLHHVKPHGALGNLAARDIDVARAIAAAVRQIDDRLAILAISGTCTETAARAAGVPVYSEIFADRGYLSSGQLVPRGQPGAMIEDAGAAADRLISFLRTGLMPVIDGAPIKLAAQSICVHGDSPGAVAMARGVRARLEAEGVTFAAFGEV